MATTTPPLVPDKPGTDGTDPLVLNDFGPLGRAYVEADETKADETTVVKNILAGQYSHPLRVIAFNMAEGWADDVTEDIAIAVLSRARSDHRFRQPTPQGGNMPVIPTSGSPGCDQSVQPK